MTNLWSFNTPAQFWLCLEEQDNELWDNAIQNALPILPEACQTPVLDDLLNLLLGEKQFGENPWEFSAAKRLYYNIKPYLSPVIKQAIRRSIRSHREANFPLNWPIEPRYAKFLWEVMRQVLILSGQSALAFRYFWPDRGRYAFALSHDIESAEGQNHVRYIADLEEGLGFRSSFAFVPERYPLDYGLIEDLRNRGFEIAVHGLKHDGKDFQSYAEFMRRAPRINQHLKALQAKSFYAALTLRQPEWMQTLEIEYDRSFFDTDPYEPNPGGVMSIWPFRIGHFLELPYTLAQDYTLAILLQEREPKIWLDKVEFIKEYHGMALMVTHPDYLKEKPIERMYLEFLQRMKDYDDYWFALPHELAAWWRKRGENPQIAEAVLDNDCLRIVF